MVVCEMDVTGVQVCPYVEFVLESFVLRAGHFC